MISIKQLTQAQYDILKCIEDYIKINSFPPTYREIAVITKRISISTIYNHLRLLMKKGYITMQEGCSRTIKITASFNEDSIKKV